MFKRKKKTNIKEVIVPTTISSAWDKENRKKYQVNLITDFVNKLDDPNTYSTLRDTQAHRGWSSGPQTMTKEEQMAACQEGEILKRSILGTVAYITDTAF